MVYNIQGETNGICKAKKFTFAFFILVTNLFFSQEKWSESILISNKGSNRATHYLESNKIIENNKFIITTILEFDNDTFYNSIYRLNKKTKSLESYKFHESLKDNHCGASILVDNKGYIYVVIGAHHGSIKTYISRKPWCIKAFDFLTELKGVYTYPSLVLDENKNTLYLSLRETNNDNNWTTSMFRFENKKWKRISDPLIGNFGDWYTSKNSNELKHTRGYQNFSSTFRFDTNSRIHLLYRVYEYVPSNFNIQKGSLNPFQKFGMSYMIGYSFSDDFGKTWMSKKGDKLKQIPPKEANIIKGNFNPQKTNSYFEVSNLMIWKGYPVFMFSEKTKDNRKLYLCRINELNNYEIKEIKTPRNFIAFGKPRITVDKEKMFFVVSVMKKNKYNEKDTWGGSNNKNLYGVIDLDILKLVRTDLIHIKPSWTATLPYNKFISKTYLPILVNEGDLKLKQGSVFLLY